MPVYEAASSLEIAVPASAAYAIIADYRDGHPRILPRPPFGELMVEKGGVGAGTEIRFEMHAFGRRRWVRARISEPEQGRVLQEAEIAGAFVTTFTVDALAPERCRVTIKTVAQSARGLKGLVERTFSRPFLRSLFLRELKLLAEIASAS